MTGIAQKERLAVRLGREHEITDAYNEMLDSVLACHRFCRKHALADSGATSEAHDERRQLMKSMQEQINAFADFAFRAAASQV
jgi:hypothetical protein